MNYAVVLSGGTGTRLGLDIPKQYYKVNNKPIIGYVLDTLFSHKAIDGVVIVAGKEWQPFIEEEIALEDKFLGFAEPGENRQLSILNGLLLLEEHFKCEPDVNIGAACVLIQDAARPCTSSELITSCLSLAEDEDGAMPVLPMKDTVYLSHTGTQIDGLLDRQKLYAGQAPENFRFEKYLVANKMLLPEKIFHINGSSEPAVLAGMKIKLVTGDEHNYKITTEADLVRFCEQMEKALGEC